MTRRKLSHVVAAGILAALLALPGPLLAQPRHQPSGLVDLWSRLAEVWRWGISSVGVGRNLQQKQGLGIDPNGGTSTGSGVSTGQIAPSGSGGSGTWSEVGHGAN